MTGSGASWGSRTRGACCPPVLLSLRRGRPRLTDCFFPWAPGFSLVPFLGFFLEVDSYLSQEYEQTSAHPATHWLVHPWEAGSVSTTRHR